MGNCSDPRHRDWAATIDKLVNETSNAWRVTVHSNKVITITLRIDLLDPGNLGNIRGALKTWGFVASGNDPERHEETWIRSGLWINPCI